MDSREGGPEESVSESDEEGGDGTGGIGCSRGMGSKGSSGGVIQTTLPIYLGHKHGYLSGGSSPWELGLAYLHLVLMDSM